MQEKPQALLYLIDALSSLPSVGQKLARRLAFFLLQQDEIYFQNFITRLQQAKKEIKYCPQCNNFSLDGQLCSICNDIHRQHHELCIVNDFEQLEKIEATQIFHGLYFILNQEIVLSKHQTLDHMLIQQLKKFLVQKQFQQITLATNLTANGQATALFLKQIINQILPNALIFRLAIGLPINSSLEYADNFTIEAALKNKIKF